MTASDQKTSSACSCRIYGLGGKRSLLIHQDKAGVDLPRSFAYDVSADCLVALTC